MLFIILILLFYIFLYICSKPRTCKGCDYCDITIRYKHKGYKNTKKIVTYKCSYHKHKLKDFTPCEHWYVWEY